MYLSSISPEADRKRRHINYNKEEEEEEEEKEEEEDEDEEEEEEGRDDRIVAHRGQTKEGIVDPPDDCNLLASGTHLLENE